jgi:hypothetical protein
MSEQMSHSRIILGNELVKSTKLFECVSNSSEVVNRCLISQFKYPYPLLFCDLGLLSQLVFLTLILSSMKWSNNNSAYFIGLLKIHESIFIVYKFVF